uniref:Uncharacterized protein n=1 Tax=Labrus bergylta TaxID=56723 RepID=A0A3Q3EXK7_9LABR
MKGEGPKRYIRRFFHSISLEQLLVCGLRTFLSLDVFSAPSTSMFGCACCVDVSDRNLTDEYIFYGLVSSYMIKRKELNTFIVGAGQRIRTMCGSKIGEVTSPDTFNTIDCKLQQGSVYPNFTCVNGYPVHYNILCFVSLCWQNH